MADSISRTGEERGVAFELDDDAVALVAGLDLAHLAGENGAAVVDEADGVAELLDLVHAMGGEEDGLALLLELDQRALKQRGIDGIETGEGLVHDDQPGIVEQRCR